MAGSGMTTTGNGRGLVMTHETGLYSFHCKSQTNCFWVREETELKISRSDHIMLTVPSTLVDNCDCDLDTSGNCKCPAGVTGDDCDRCKESYWGLDLDGENGCKRKFSKSMYDICQIFSFFKI